MAVILVSLMTAPSRPALAVGPEDHVPVEVTGALSDITSSPSLTPAFAASVHDYAIRCQPGVNHVDLTLTGAASITVGQRSGRTVNVTVTLGENQAVVVTTTSNGAAEEYWIRCLPHDFPHMRFARPGNPPEGWYLTGTISGALDGSSSPYAMILDNHGTPVWYQKAPRGALDTKVLPGQTLAWAPLLGPGVGADPNGGYNLYDLATQTSTTLKTPTPPTDPHELLQLPNGNRVMIATPLRSGFDLSSFGAAVARSNNTIVDCIVEEMSPTGELVWGWRASDHIAAEESTRPAELKINGQWAADIYHCNSVDLEPAVDTPVDTPVDTALADVLLSVRHTDSVYKINRPNGAIVWKLGGNQSAGVDNAPRLTIVGDPQADISGQHDARFQGPRGISLYDNHSFLPGYARGVQYDIDEVSGTATRVWEYAAPDGRNSLATGSFRRYADGTNLIGWGFKKGANAPEMEGFTEVDQNGRVLLSMTYPRGDVQYRVVKEPPGALDVNLLRRTSGLPRPRFPSVSWQPLGGVLTSKPGGAAWAANRLDVFGRGTDDQMWHKWWDGAGWYGWEPLGGVLTSGPGVASWGSGRLDVFVKGTDQQLWHKWWDGTGWYGWEPLGGLLTSGPAAASWGSGRLDVVVAGVGGALWHKSFDSVWSDWEPLGGATFDDPAITSWGTNRADVFVKGTDGQLWHRWRDATGWQPWKPLGGNPTTGPSATSLGTGLIDVGTGGAGRTPQRLPYNGQWQLWQPLGGLTDHPPALVALGSAEERVLATGTDRGLWIGDISEATSASSVKASAAPPPSRADAARL